MDDRTRLQLDLTVSPVRLFLVLFAVETAILVVDIVVFHTIEHRDLRHLVDLNLEANIPTIYSVVQTLAVAAVAALLARLYPGLVRGHRPTLNHLRRYGWLAIAAFFAFIAIDDGAQIHERIATAWSDIAKASEEAVAKDAIESFESYYWQLLLLPFFVAAGIAMAIFVKRELGGWRIAWLFFAGLGFYANAVVLDYFDAYRQLYQLVGGLLDWQPDTAKHMARNVEEYIEMFGTTCILVAFVRHLGAEQPDKGSDT